MIRSFFDNILRIASAYNIPCDEDMLRADIYLKGVYETQIRTSLRGLDLIDVDFEPFIHSSVLEKYQSLIFLIDVASYYNDISRSFDVFRDAMTSGRLKRKIFIFLISVGSFDHPKRKIFKIRGSLSLDFYCSCEDTDRAIKCIMSRFIWNNCPWNKFYGQIININNSSEMAFLFSDIELVIEKNELTVIEEEQAAKMKHNIPQCTSLSSFQREQKYQYSRQAD